MSSQSSGGNAATRVAAFRDRVESLVGRTPWLDHAVRAATRYTEVRGPLLSAGVTYYSFLALFPLVALSYGVVRFLSRFVPDLEQSFNDALDGVLPISVGGSPGVVLSVTEDNIPDETKRARSDEFWSGVLATIREIVESGT